MPAFNLSLVARTKEVHRSNWVGKNAGIVVVFCIVFVIAAGLIGLFLYRKVAARVARRADHRERQVG